MARKKTEISTEQEKPVETTPIVENVSHQEHTKNIDCDDNDSGANPTESTNIPQVDSIEPVVDSTNVVDDNIESGENVSTEQEKPVETTIKIEPTKEQVAPKIQVDKSTQNTTTEKLPENIQKVLQAFSDIPEMYINSVGRVFTKGSKPSLRGNAILYKNPFYKSKK